MVRGAKSLTDEQRSHIADVLRRLRDHFPAWSKGAEGHEHDLMAFAYYEGCGHRPGWECCRDILAEAAPFVVGQALVASHGFRWVMIRARRSWRFGVEHRAMDRPIDLSSLEDGSWNEREYDQPPAPGTITFDSLETIVERVSLLAQDADAGAASDCRGSRASRRFPRRRDR
jgi:hypothetical protein